MAWNNAKERYRFLKMQEAQEQWYRNEGMTQEQIEQMRQFDHMQFCADRRYHEAVIENEDDREPVDTEDMRAYPHPFESAEIRIETAHPEPYFWLEEIRDERLYFLLLNLTDTEKQVLHMLAFEGIRKAEIARRMHCHHSRISRMVEHIRACAVKAGCGIPVQHACTHRRVRRGQ